MYMFICPQRGRESEREEKESVCVRECVCEREGGGGEREREKERDTHRTCWGGDTKEDAAVCRRLSTLFAR
jgi:hypothetical protein